MSGVDTGQRLGEKVVYEGGLQRKRLWGRRGEDETDSCDGFLNTGLQWD